MRHKLITTILISLLLLSVIGCGSNTTNQITQEGTTSATKTTGTSEMQKYAEFEAEFACKLLGVEDASEVMNIMADFANLAEKHDFSAERIEDLKLDYEDSLEFQNILMTEMKNQCPEKMTAAGMN